MASVVPVYSIAKPYTAIAILRSFESDLAMGDLLHRLPTPLMALPLNEVLKHRSGLNDYYGWSDYRAAVDARKAPWPEADIVARAELGPAGDFSYSNIGYLLLRLALEKRHGTSFFEVLDDLVFRPLDVRAHPFAELADWDRCDHPGIDDHLRTYHPGWVYPGTFAADPTEAARGLGLVMRGALGSKLALRLRETSMVQIPPTHPMSPNAGYGCGVMTKGDPVTVLGHGGQGPGFTLFAAASVDGSRWHGEAQAAETEDLELIQRCIALARP